MNKFELKRIRFKLYQLTFRFILKRGFLWIKIFKCHNFVPITCMQREFQCLESISRIVNVKNSHSHWRVVFGPYKSDTFRNFCLLKIIQILSWLVFFETKIVLVKQFDKPHIELVNLTQFLTLAWIEKISVWPKIVYFNRVFNNRPHWFIVLNTRSIHHKRSFQLESLLFSFDRRHSFEFAQCNFKNLQLANLSEERQFFLINSRRSQIQGFPFFF
jgi:hypothetical protein